MNQASEADLEAFQTKQIRKNNLMSNLKAPGQSMTLYDVLGAIQVVGRTQGEADIPNRILNASPEQMIPLLPQIYRYLLDTPHAAIKMYEYHESLMESWEMHTLMSCDPRGIISLIELNAKHRRRAYLPVMAMVGRLRDLGPTDSLTPEMILVLMKIGTLDAHYYLMECLQMMESRGVDLAPILIKGMNVGCDQTRRLCAEWLGYEVSHAEEIVPVLRLGLYDTYYRVRYYSAWSLARLGKPAQVAIRDLKVLQSDPDFTVRQYAQAALEKLTGISAPAKLPVLQPLGKMMADVGKNWARHPGD